MNWLGRLWSRLAWHGYVLRRRVRGLGCLVTGHRHKFGTYPRRGMCVRCGRDLPRS
jgi:hypothetical protein